MAAARTFLTILAAAPLVFLGLFLFNTPVTNLVFPADVEVSLAAVQSDTPVVFVLFDEFPVISLLDEDGGRREALSRTSRGSPRSRPGFATHDFSSSTGRGALDAESKYPAGGKLPVYQNHPATSSRCSEGLPDERDRVETRLCPPALRQESAPTRAKGSPGSTRTRGSSTCTYSPAPARGPAPAIDESWGNLATRRPKRATACRAPRTSRSGGAETSTPAACDFADFVRWIKAPVTGEPTLDFLHVLLPTALAPLPERGGSAVASRRAPGRDGELWWDGGLADQAWRRHLLRLGYADLELGRLIAKLEKTELWTRR